MEYIKLAIVSDDHAYAEAVTRSLLIGNRNFDLSLFQCEGFCERWEKEGIGFREGFDLILWDSEIIEEACRSNIIWLTERRSTADAKPPQAYVIWKYNSSMEMVAAVFRFYEELTGRHPAAARPDRVDVFALVSWQGGSGCTTLSMALGQELIRYYRKRVLYLSLEGLESTAMYMNTPEGMRTAGEFLYHLSSGAKAGRPANVAQAGFPERLGGGSGEGSGTDHTAPFLEEYLIRDSSGMESFAPGKGCNPLSTAQPRELSHLLSALMNSGRFDVILIDAGNGTGEQVREVLSGADRILLVSSREEPARETAYRAFLLHGIGGQALQRVLRVRNCCEADACDSSGSGVCIGRQDSSVQPLLLEGKFGRDVHKLAELCYN